MKRILLTGTAVAALMTAAGAASAGSCAEQPDGAYLCEGAADPAGQDAVINVDEPGNLDVALAPGFGFDSGQAGGVGPVDEIELFSGGDLSVDGSAANGGVLTRGAGDASKPTAMTLRADGSLTADLTGTAFDVDTTAFRAEGSGVDLTFGEVLSRSVNGFDFGVFVATSNGGQVRAEGPLTFRSGYGLSVGNTGPGKLNIDIVGDVTGLGDSPIAGALWGVNPLMDSGSGDLDLTINGDVTTVAAESGYEAIGVVVQNRGDGDVRISGAGDVVSSGVGVSVEAEAGSGDVVIDTEGRVRGGDTGAGVFVLNQAGSLTDVTVSEAGSTRFAGVEVVTNGELNLEVRSGGLIEGGVASGLGGTGTAQAVIRNGGEIRAHDDPPPGDPGGLGGGLAVAAVTPDGGARDVSMENLSGGLIVGRVLTGDGDDVFLNLGEWRAAGAGPGPDFVSDFGGGVDELRNEGRFTAAESGGFERVRLSGLERLVSSGEISLGDGFAGDRLELSGDYVGGGVLILDTVLGDTGSETDRVDILGDVISGQTLVRINNVGGAGAATGTGSSDGIPVVIVEGSTSNGDFVLDGPVEAGGHVYALNLRDPDTWALQSPDADPAWRPGWKVTPRPGPDPTPDPDPTPGPAPVTPVTSVPGHETAAPFVLDLVRPLTHRDRVGDRLTRGAPAPNEAVGWAKVRRDRVEGSSEGSDVSAAYSARTTALELGYDFGLDETENGRLVGGFAFTYRDGSVGASSPFGGGGAEGTAFGAGPVLSFYGNDGSYVDGRLTFYSTELEPDGVDGAVEGSALTASIEAGKRYELEDGWGLTPEAQLSYASVDHDGFTGPDGETVSLLDGDRTTFRASAVLDRAWEAEHGPASAHLGLDAIFPLDGETAVSVNGSRFSREDDAVRLGVSAGFDVPFDEGARIQGSLAGSRGRDGSSEVTAGLSVRWEF